MHSQSIYYALPFMVLFMALRMWRGGRERRVRIETLWILPLVFTLLIGAGIAAQPPPMTPVVIGALVLGLAGGLAGGWLRGRMTHITVDTQTHQLKGKTSPIGVLIIAGLFLVRSIARDQLTAHAAEWHVSAAAIIDGFMLFALGMIVGSRIEILVRCLRLLKQARAGGPVEISEDHA